MKNLHVLPTDKPSKLWLYKNFNNLLTGLTVEKSKDIHPQNIYITSDAEIKEGDYVYHNSGYVSIVLGFNLDAIKLTDAQRWSKDCKKIILTTDQDLIADGVQAIDDEFLQWFIKNPSCENIEIEEEDYSQKCRECGETVKRGYICNRGCFMKSSNFIPTDKNIKYKIIIPKKEPNKTHYLDELPNMGKEVLVKIWESAMPKLEPKQETLEEVVERLYLSYENNELLYGHSEDLQLAYKAGIFDGVKWQAEKMYSEEEVLELLHKRMIHTLGDDYQETTTTKWFKQFKKK